MTPKMHCLRLGNHYAFDCARATDTTAEVTNTGEKHHTCPIENGKDVVRLYSWNRTRYTVSTFSLFSSLEYGQLLTSVPGRPE